MRLGLQLRSAKCYEMRCSLGFFGGFVFDGQTWVDWNPDAAVPHVAEPWLSVLIHDSDVATVGYAPAGDGSGLAYLGTTPRVYFDDDHATAPTDVAREAEALARWRSDLSSGVSGPIDRWVAAVRPFLAADDDPEPSDDDDLADADIFVEIKAAHFLRALDLPLPAELSPHAE